MNRSINHGSIANVDRTVRFGSSCGLSTISLMEFFHLVLSQMFLSLQTVLSNEDELERSRGISDHSQAREYNAYLFLGQSFVSQFIGENKEDNAEEINEAR